MSPSQDSVPGDQTTRRDFGKQAALLAAPLVACAAFSQTPEKTDDMLTDKAPRLPKALTDLLRARFQKHLSEEQWKALEKKIEGGLRSAEQLSKFPLHNRDEPACAFHADRPT
jgi:hypothetical protein